MRTERFGAIVLSWVVYLSVIALLCGTSYAQPFSQDLSIAHGSGTLKGVIHCHSNYSDGLYSIEHLAVVAKEHGAEFLVMTDHFEDIELDKTDLVRFGCNPLNGLFADEAGLLKATIKRSGISNYIQECADATSSVGILVVPGIEVGIGTSRDLVYDPAGGDKWDNKIHMLGIGYLTDGVAWSLHTSLGHNGTRTYSRSEKCIRLDDAQCQIAKLLHDKARMAVIIAHPYLNDAIHSFHYTLYKNKMEDIDGIEFFNDNISNPDRGNEKSLEALGVIKRDANMGGFKELAVTSGCDYHGIPGTGGEELFNRQTVIFTQSNLTDVSSLDYEVQCRVIADAIGNKSWPTIALADGRATQQGPLKQFFRDGHEINCGSSNDVKTGPVYGFTPDRSMAYFPNGIRSKNSNTLSVGEMRDAGPRGKDNVLTAPPTGGKLKITVVGHEGLSRNALGVIIGSQEHFITSNAMNASIGESWFIGPCQKDDTILFFIDSSYANERRYPWSQSGQFPTWQLSFEDWIDGDANDVVIQVEFIAADSER